MTALVGAFLGFTGGLNALNLITETPQEVKKGLDLPLSKFQKIAQVAANILKIIGTFALCLQLVAMGAFMYSAAPTLSLWGALSQALTGSIPSLLTGIGTLAAGHVIQILRE